VVVLGLPYPNRASVELQEKIKYMERQKAGRGTEYYQNLCMRAVNQSIGRAIRHSKDYAAIVLVDERYQNLGIVNRLPGWIKSNYDSSNEASFGSAIRSLAKFFIQNKSEL
jgi:chromosome transmission fidelity protein 1